MRTQRRQVTNPRFPATCRVHKLGDMCYGNRSGSKSDGFYGRLVEHYYTLNQPFGRSWPGYRNYAWVLEDPKTGKRLSFQYIGTIRPPR